MTNTITGLLALFNYIMAGVNVYSWETGSEMPASNLGMAVICFGIGNFLAVHSRDR